MFETTPNEIRTCFWHFKISQVLHQAQYKKPNTFSKLLQTHAEVWYLITVSEDCGAMRHNLGYERYLFNNAEGPFQKRLRALNVHRFWNLNFHLWIKCTSFNICVEFQVVRLTPGRGYLTLTLKDLIFISIIYGFETATPAKHICIPIRKLYCMSRCRSPFMEVSI